MSAYGHQMEREFSAQTLGSRSRGDSEMESRYTVETGIYMSSFAATVFIAGLVTFGVSLITILIALTIMLHSCQSQSSGPVQLQKSTDAFDYCKIFAQNIELNHLDSDSFPAMCKEFTVQYVKGGHYMRDLNNTLRLVENYLDSIRPGEDGRDVVLMDADDFFPSEFFYINHLLKRDNQYACGHCNQDSIYPYHKLVHEVYFKFRAGGWPLILLSRKPETLRTTMVEHLISVGCSDWSLLIMRMDDEMQMDSQKYFSQRRSIMQKQGFHIVAAISSDLDVLTGSCPETRNFKLPSLFFGQKMEHHVGSRIPEEQSSA